MKWSLKIWLIMIVCLVISSLVTVLPAVAEETTSTITTVQVPLTTTAVSQPLKITITAKGKEKEILVIQVKVKNEGAFIQDVRFHVEGENGIDVAPFLRLEEETSIATPADVYFARTKKDSTFIAGKEKSAMYYLEVPSELDKTDYSLKLVLQFQNNTGVQETVEKIFPVTIGKPFFLITALRYVIDILAKNFYGYGIAIILFALLIKLVLWPLNTITMKSQHQMMSIQPKVNEINQLYKTDPQKKQEEIMKLYREEKINPASGCLPMLPQLVILMGLYQALQSYTPLYRDSFLWLKSLGSPDPYFIFPILAGVTTLLQSISSGQSKDPQSKMIVYFMPIFFFYIMMRFPAGLSLFWTAYGLFSWAQQHFFNLTKKNLEKPGVITMPEPKKGK
ncbi:YidC/Oxa1 family membrane protein insertase [bacterium]|nr:YidC/Oxa1 family membrane protein insertase [bacterium]